MTGSSWDLEGHYLESCNCDSGCPCLFNSPPTKGFCNFIGAFGIDHGTYGDLAFSGLRVVSAIHSPGPMWEGNYRQALYVDERADEGQRRALETIFTGKAGGGDAFVGLFGDLVSEFLGSRYVQIDYDFEAGRVEIPGILEFTVRPIEGITGKVPKIVDADFIPVHRVGRSSRSTYRDHGLDWDSSQGHAFLSELDLSGP